MKKIISAFLCALLFVNLTYSSGEKSTKYYLTNTSSIMSVAMKGDVSWSEKLNGQNLEITIGGRFQDFVIKRIWYNFNEGAIKSFSMVPAHPDTEKITISLRQNAEYKIYQNKETKRFVIELVTGKVPAAFFASPTKPLKKQEKAVVVPPINISQIAQKQVEENVESAKQQPEKNIIVPVRSDVTVADKSQYSALLLVLSSAMIFIGGGVVVAFVFYKRKNLSVPLKRNNEMVSLARPFISEAKKNIVIDDSQKDFDHSIEFAEDYLRTQGELDLQARLQQLTNISRHQRVGKTVFAKKVRKQERMRTAQQLGVSVGELDLVSRLEQFQKLHSAESV